MAVRKVRAKRVRRRTRRNVQMGFWAGGTFHPIRASDDYDPEDVGERYQYKPAKTKKKKAKKKNPASVKLARTGHTGFLRARAVDVITRNGRVVEVKVKR